MKDLDLKLSSTNHVGLKFKCKTTTSFIKIKLKMPNSEHLENKNEPIDHTNT